MVNLKDLHMCLNNKDEYDNIDFKDLDCVLSPKKLQGNKISLDKGLFQGKKDIISALDIINNSKNDLVYALIAPAFMGQFDVRVTPGKLRTAFKNIGFDGMVEVALFADILTLREALEFDRNIKRAGDYQLTSCCCPMWIAMIRKIYAEIAGHLTASVSPMIACGRVIKKINPSAKTIFIGPCVAKKAEAKDKNLAGAIDLVLTFQEVNEIFNAVNINFGSLKENEKDHSSQSGRIYARAGGVSEAVKTTVNRINPHRDITIQTKKADGIVECKKMIKEILDGKISANFFEGMGCAGGCVGGPKVIIDREDCRNNVNKYGKEAPYSTAIDNPYVIELLHRLGIDTVNDLLNDNGLFTYTIR